MKEAGLALQEAIYTALTGDATLMALITGVYDDIPEATAFPYLMIGEISAIDYSTKSTDGREHRVEVHVWSEYHGAKETRDIFAELNRVLHKASLSLTDHTLINMRYADDDIIRDVDEPTRHGIIEYRAVTQEI